MWWLNSSHAKIIILHGHSTILNQDVVGFNKRKVLKLSSCSHGNQIRVVQNTVKLIVNFKVVWIIIKSGWTVVAIAFVEKVRVSLINKCVESSCKIVERKISLANIEFWEHKEIVLIV
jgi:hypothetical protein